jgi:hypothetical protein
MFCINLHIYFNRANTKKMIYDEENEWDGNDEDIEWADIEHMGNAELDDRRGRGGVAIHFQIGYGICW